MLEEQRHNNNIAIKRLELERDNAAAEREQKPPGETAGLMFLQNNGEKLYSAASEAHGAGKTRAQAEADIRRANPGAPPYAVKIVLDDYEWAG